MDIFGKKRIKELQDRVRELESYLTPDLKELETVNKKIAEKSEEHNRIINSIEKSLKEKRAIDSEILVLKSRLIQTKEEELYQSFGLYSPRYAFTTSDQYKERIHKIREEQKTLIKNKKAVTGAINWVVNGDKRKGAKMVSDMQKLLLRAFNSECDDVIEHVKFNNVEMAEKRITSSMEAISKLGAIMEVSITRDYYQSKISELYLAYEYQQKKQEEKEHAKELRAQERENAKLARELEEARKACYKEQAHYARALEKIHEQIENCKDESELVALKEKQKELQEHHNEIEENLKQIDYREANQKAGYVYVISNIGAFGENVYKIGMTRRYSPMERIDELSDASVPFNFDVHAMIFSKDAPALEAALHRAFEDKKLNMINHRREFFRVSLDEIKRVVKDNFDQTVEFIDIAPAEQYRQTLLMQKQV